MRVRKARPTGEVNNLQTAHQVGHRVLKCGDQSMETSDWLGGGRGWIQLRMLCSDPAEAEFGILGESEIRSPHSNARGGNVRDWNDLEQGGLGMWEHVCVQNKVHGDHNVQTHIRVTGTRDCSPKP